MGHRQAAHQDLPQAWKPASTGHDSNREYGLNLLRKVISNKFTRNLQSEGMDILCVRLSQVMTSGLNNSTTEVCAR